MKNNWRAIRAYVLVGAWLVLLSTGSTITTSLLDRKTQYLSIHFGLWNAVELVFNTESWMSNKAGA